MNRTLETALLSNEVIHVELTLCEGSNTATATHQSSNKQNLWAS